MSEIQTSQNEVCSFIIFPDWSDSELNNEKWDADDSKEPKKPVPKRPSTIHSPVGSTTSLLLADQWRDPQKVILPNSIKDDVWDWKRPEQLFRNVELTISSEKLNLNDLRCGSSHIMHSEFMRNFMSSVGILNYITTTNPWQIEAENLQYIPNTPQLWKPWHHIYSLCKSGKGQEHNPKYNKHGKYVVRLFWMGCWRRVYVDDSLPVDVHGRVLLPGYQFAPPSVVAKPSLCIQPSKGKDNSKESKKKSKEAKGSEQSKTKKVDIYENPKYEIWPFILCKALLKVAALSWTNEEEVVDYSAIACLTGWIFHKLGTREMSPMEIWNICKGYTPKYEWKDGVPSRTEKSGLSKTSSKKNVPNDGAGSSKTGKGNSKRTKGTRDEVDEPDEEDITKLYCLIGSCTDIKGLTKESELQNIPQEWPQDILIQQYRDIPLLKPSPRPELARWKRFRWLKWAISKGLWPSDDLSIPIRCLKFCSDLNNVSEVFASSANLERKQLKGSDKKLEKKDKKGKSGELKISFPADKDLWIEFAEIHEKIISLSIFFRPSSFNSVVRMSDLFSTAQVETPKEKPKEKGKKNEKDDGKSWVDMGFHVRESRNQPRLIIMNSLGPKLFIVNLTTCGHAENISEDLTTCGESYGYVLLTKFLWYTSHFGPAKGFAKTNGTKALLLYLKPGKTILRVFAKSTRNFIVTFLSNVRMIVGTADEIYEGLSQESLLLQQTTQEVCSAFGNLINSFGTPDFAEKSRAFHKSYIGNLPLTKKEKSEIYKNFANILVETVGDTNLSFALGVLFLDPALNITCDTHINKETVSLISYGTGRKSGDTIELVDIEKMRQLAAIKIQSFFKRILEKRLFDLHKPTSPKHVDIYERLKKIYAEYFSVSKRHHCQSIMRNLYLRNPLFETTELYEDLTNTLDIKIFRGTAVGSSWIFFTRQRFFITSEFPIRIQYILSCNSQAAMLRVFNNDTFTELLGAIDKFVVSYYYKNCNGYTLLCYGRNKEPMKFSWELSMLYLRQSVPPIVVTEDTPAMISMSQIYRPNANNIVARCVLDVWQSTYLTIKFATSGKYADLQLNLYDSRNKLLKKVKGVQNIVLPLVRIGEGMKSSSANTIRERRTRTSSLGKLKPLSSKQKSLPVLVEDMKRYYIEAVVEPNTWPLTASEWLTTKLENKKHLLYPPDVEPQTSGTILRTSSGLLKSSTKQTPYWELTVIHGSKDKVTMKEDMSRREAINNIKRSWYKDDPDRRQRSIEQRENYLKNLCRTAADYCNVSQEIDVGIVSEHSVDSDILLHRWIPETLMLPTFQLCDYYGGEYTDEPIYPNIDDWGSHLKEQVEEEMLTACESFLECQEEMDDILNKQVEVCAHIRKWYDELRQDSAEMMKKAYDERQKCINIMTAAPPGEKKELKIEKAAGKKKKK